MLKKEFRTKNYDKYAKVSFKIRDFYPTNLNQAQMLDIENQRNSVSQIISSLGGLNQNIDGAYTALTQHLFAGRFDFKEGVFKVWGNNILEGKIIAVYDITPN